MDAAKRMVDMKGGNDKLGLNGFLSALVDTLTCAVALRDPIGKSPGLSILYITYVDFEPRLPQLRENEHIAILKGICSLDSLVAKSQN